MPGHFGARRVVTLGAGIGLPRLLPLLTIAQGAPIGTSFGLFAFAEEPVPPDLGGFTIAQGSPIGTNASRS